MGHFPVNFDDFINLRSLDVWELNEQVTQQICFSDLAITDEQFILSFKNLTKLIVFQGDQSPRTLSDFCLRRIYFKPRELENYMATRIL